MKAEYKLKHTPKGGQMKTFFTSDTHYGHTNICRGESRWEGKRGCRDFDSVPEMNEAIIEGINSSVGKHDILYHLGDWSFGGFKNIEKFRNRLDCKTIHLITGNHDYQLLKSGLASLFTSVNQLKSRKVCGQMISMCHFPLLVWENHSSKKHPSWMLHGHCHGSMKDKNYIARKTLDVGIDTHPEFRPYAFEEIEVIMRKKEIKLIDRH